MFPIDKQIIDSFNNSGIKEKYKIAYIAGANFVIDFCEKQVCSNCISYIFSNGKLCPILVASNENEKDFGCNQWEGK